MINRPNNWENVREFTDRQKIPVGAYVCKVRKAVCTNTDYGAQLCILFDIEDGEFAGYYENDYKNNTNEDKKWKGVLRQWLPKDDGSERDEWTKSSLKGMVTAFERSNPGYTWNWEEASLSGKLIGILMRNEEWEYNGKTGWTVRPFRAISVDSVEDGTFTIPKDKPLKNKAATTANVINFSQFETVNDDDDDLPF